MPIKKALFHNPKQDLIVPIDKIATETIKSILDPRGLLLKKIMDSDQLEINENLRQCIESFNDPNLKRRVTDIFSEIVNPILTSVFQDTPCNDIRVSLQAKYAWSDIDLKSDNRNDQDYSNTHFPTRPHQDLVNNGLISSHTIVFYLNLTEDLVQTNTMEVGTPREGPQYILQTTDQFGYPNELTPKSMDSLSWQVPDYNSGLYVFTAMKPHRSGRFSKYPRLAVNAKFQPRLLSYVNYIYDLDYDISDYNSLHSLLEEGANTNPGLFLELAALRVFRGDQSGAEEYIRRLVPSGLSEFQLHQYLYGIKTREIYSRTPPLQRVIPSLPLCDIPVSPGSCVDSIRNSLCL